MDLLPKVTEAISVILGGLTVGYIARRRGWLPGSTAEPLTCWLLAYVSPAPIVLAMWSLPVDDWKAAALPLIYVTQTILLWPAAALAANILRLDNTEKAAFIPPAMFSNQGFTYGSFVCYIAMGPQGLAMAALYILPFILLLYTVGFAVPGRYIARQDGGLRQAITESLIRSYRRNPLLALLAGLVLALWRVPQPEFIPALLDVLMPVSAFALLFAIGLTIRLSTVKDYLGSVAAMHLLKFVVQPALGIGLATLLGFWSQPGHAFLKVVLIQTMTPSAVMSLAVVQVLGLKSNLANACWLTTNLVAIPLAGVLVWLTGLP